MVVKDSSDLFGSYKLKKKTGGQRGDLLQQIHEVTGMPFDVVLKNTYHLKGAEGIKVLEMILEDTLMSSDSMEWRRFHCAKLIRKSKPEKRLNRLSTGTV